MSESLRIACPHCHALNRVPAGRLGEAPICGSCRKPLFAGSSIELGVDNVAAHVRGDLPVLIDFWAPWCGPCLAMAPQFDIAAKALEPRLRLAKINTQNEPVLAQRYSIRSIPTMILFDRERELARRSGAMPADAIAAWARQVLAQHEG